MQDLPGGRRIYNRRFHQTRGVAVISFIGTPIALGRRHSSPDKDRTASFTLGAGAVVMDGEVIKGKCRQI